MSAIWLNKAVGFIIEEDRHGFRNWMSLIMSRKVRCATGQALRRLKKAEVRQFS
jgi:hypothetical protein